MTTLLFHYPDASTRPGRPRCALILLLACLLPASQLAAQTSGPMLYPKGKVLVDGRDVSRPIALFAGDKVETSDSASASLAAVGSTVLLSPNTVLTFNPKGLEMGCGHLLVTTVVNRMSSRVANLTVTPQGDVAKYEITRASGKLEIATREGSINVNDGVQTTSVHAGNLISFNSTNDCPMPAAADQPPVPASKPVSLSKGKIAAIALGAAAAGGVGLALALSRGGSKAPISPSVP
ncbi:MAG TPA: hypothetical protein VJQ50_13090 [Terriglobales bacterium]|nr:hypothetical protein [Terriglobales bacterium]